MTPDFILGDTSETIDVPENADIADVSEETVSHRVRVYDGLVVDPAGNPGTIGADSNGD